MSFLRPLGVAVNHRRRDTTSDRAGDQPGEWVDDGTTYYLVAVWGELAENVAVSLHCGDRVVVLGGIRSRSFETAAGQRRTRMEVVADEVTPSLRYAAAEVTKTTRPAATGASAEVGDDAQAPF